MNNMKRNKFAYSNEHNENMFMNMPMSYAKAPMSIGTDTEANDEELSLFVPRAFGKQNYHNLRLS
jgi:hypothetical protein